MTPTFSDEDLKQFKDYAEWTDSDDPTAHRMFVEDKDICALLHRLECAEAVLLEIERFNNGILTDTSEFHKWLAAKGIGK